MFLFRKRAVMPSPEDTLPGRPNPIPTAERHFVNGRPLPLHVRHRIIELALLGVRDRALTLGQVRRVLEPLLAYLDERELRKATRRILQRVEAADEEGGHAEVVVLQVDIEVGQDQLVLDELPDDPGHLVAVELDDGALDLDLAHVLSLHHGPAAGPHRGRASGGGSGVLFQRSAMSACLARTASAASRSAASSLSERSPSTTFRTPSRPISASTPR